MEGVIKRIENYDVDEEIARLHELNKELTPEDIKKVNSVKQYVLEGCSDSRFIQRQVDPDRKAIIKYNAGNQFDPEDALHPEMDTYVILAHVKEGDAGCGACGVAGELESMDPEKVERLKNDHPHLYNVGSSAKCSVRGNLEAAIAHKKAVAKELGRDIKVVGAIYNHVEGRLEDEFTGDVEQAQDIVDLLKKGNETYRESGHSAEVDREPYHLGKGQNPKFLVYNTTGHEFSAYFKEGNEFERPNMVFESSHFQGGKVTSIAQGSLDYAFNHGLKKEEGHFHDFQDSKEFIAVVNNPDELNGLVQRLKDDMAFQGWVERGGKAYAAIPDKNKLGLTFYQLE